MPALYATLAQVGILSPDRLANHLSVRDSIYWHPNATVPGIEFHAGSLGHNLSVAAGVAMDCKLRHQENRVVVMTGDGELNEGSNWEACLVASAYELDNLVVIVDRNAFQANMRTEDLVPLEPLQSKFESFGCGTMRFDGHDFAEIEAALADLPIKPGKPSVLIADTIRGQGLPSIKKRADRWMCNFTHQEVEDYIAELHQAQRDRRAARAQAVYIVKRDWVYHEL